MRTGGQEPYSHHVVNAAYGRITGSLTVTVVPRSISTMAFEPRAEPIFALGTLRPGRPPSPRAASRRTSCADGEFEKTPARWASHCDESRDRPWAC